MTDQLESTLRLTTRQSCCHWSLWDRTR